MKWKNTGSSGKTLELAPLVFINDFFNNKQLQNSYRKYVLETVLTKN